MESPIHFLRKPLLVLITAVTIGVGIFAGSIKLHAANGANEMSAYIVCDVVVKDQNSLMEYLELSEHTLEYYGGKFLVQAGAIEVIEGAWNPNVIVIAEFPSMEKAKQWYQSNTYAKALSVKSKAIDRNMILVNGII